MLLWKIELNRIDWTLGPIVFRRVVARSRGAPDSVGELDLLALYQALVSNNSRILGLTTLPSAFRGSPSTGRKRVGTLYVAS